MHCHHEFVDTGEVYDVDQRLQFRSREQVEADLHAVGLQTIDVWRNWSRDPFTGGVDQPLMVFEVERR